MDRIAFFANQNMIRPKVKKAAFWVSVGLVIIIIGTLLINWRIFSYSKDRIFTNSDALPNAQAVLVLGARVKSTGELSGILQDRADTALDLYHSEKVKKILVSGDHGRKNYDEVNALKDYFLNRGVPAADIFLDHAGFDTYDSLYRARDIFKVESIIIATQNFHLPRAVYIGKKLGLSVSGYSADKHRYLGQWRLSVRETFARVKAYFSILFKAKPKFLGDAIPLDGDSLRSWDEI